MGTLGSGSYVKHGSIVFLCATYKTMIFLFPLSFQKVFHSKIRPEDAHICAEGDKGEIDQHVQP